MDRKEHFARIAERFGLMALLVFIVDGVIVNHYGRGFATNTLVGMAFLLATVAAVAGVQSLFTRKVGRDAQG